jgi:hypothetical protein
MLPDQAVMFVSTDTLRRPYCYHSVDRKSPTETLNNAGCKRLPWGTLACIRCPAWFRISVNNCEGSIVEVIAYHMYKLGGNFRLDRFWNEPSYTHFTVRPLNIRRGRALLYYCQTQRQCVYDSHQCVCCRADFLRNKLALSDYTG